jgi:hypothetical protein
MKQPATTKRLAVAASGDTTLSEHFANLETARTFFRDARRRRFAEYVASPHVLHQVGAEIVSLQSVLDALDRAIADEQSSGDA